MFLCHNKVRSIFDVNMTLSDFENLKCFQNSFEQYIIMKLYYVPNSYIRYIYPFQILSQIIR